MKYKISSNMVIFIPDEEEEKILPKGGPKVAPASRVVSRRSKWDDEEDNEEV